MDDNRIDSFDDLFEPFDLDEEAPIDEEEAAPPPPVERPRTVACPSCGTTNPVHNRHCEACGARLTRAPLPVAPPPMVRATPGSRALGVLAGVVLVVAVVALVFNLTRSDDDGTAGDDTTTTTAATTTTVDLTVTRLEPIEVVASSELTGFEAENLVDADPTTYWNDRSLRGAGAELTFRFSGPVQILEIEIDNLDEEEKFRRNYRVQGYQIISNDLPTPVSGVLDDVMDPEPIRIPSLETVELTFRVTSVYPSESFNGNVPYDELAIKEFRFFGQER